MSNVSSVITLRNLKGNKKSFLTLFIEENTLTYDKKGKIN